MDKTSQQTLLSFLHDLGIVLYFPDPHLQVMGILNPEWVTQGVYCIINSHELFQNEGLLTPALLAQILDERVYPLDKQIYIVDMMRKFELCYTLLENDSKYLVPDLLSKEEKYTGNWDDALAFQIHYNILPSNVITRFIVRMHPYICKHTVWRTGVLLKDKDNEALVKTDQAAGVITIKIRGPLAGRREFLSQIRATFKQIHQSIKGITVEEKIPIPDHPEIQPVSYDYLWKLESNGYTSIPLNVPNGPIIDLNIRHLLNGIVQISERQTININVDHSNIGVIGDATVKGSINNRKENRV